MESATASPSFKSSCGISLPKQVYYLFEILLIMYFRKAFQVFAAFLVMGGMRSVNWSEL